MVLFLSGIAILGILGHLYGKYCERVFGPDDRPTPAITEADGVDFVGMKKHKNQLIELLNIAGTGPILGPIQGILFGPIAFITIPLGCVIAGGMHDYFVGMISMRNKGAQMPKMVNKYIGKGTNLVYNIVNWALLLLVGVVFIYTPGDLIVKDLLGMDVNSNVIYIVYAVIILYYILATLFPIDKIIGKIYPFFGALLLISAVGIFAGLLLTGSADLHNITEGAFVSEHPLGARFLPVFFITVSCGLMSGFHGSQVTLISRTVTDEREGRETFFNMMLLEGFIAMCWAAGAMVVYNTIASQGVNTPATLMVGEISRRFMGNIGGLFAIAAVIILPITSGDTAFRSLRLMVAEQFNIDQSKPQKRVMLSLAIFAPAVAILVFAKADANGFSLLWRYFGFANQFTAVFAMLLAAVYLKIHGKNYYIALIPGAFYAFIVSSYIMNADIGFRLDKLLGVGNYVASYAVGAAFAIFFIWFVSKVSVDNKDRIIKEDEALTKYVMSKKK